LYRDADEVESFGAKALILAGTLQALLEHLGITTAPRYRIMEVPCSERVEFKAIAGIFFGSRVLSTTRDQLSGPLAVMLCHIPKYSFRNVNHFPTGNVNFPKEFIYFNLK
jgi:hypothetical protein